MPQLSQQLIQPAAIDELHREVMEPFVLADLEDRDDVGMVQPGDDAGLAQEALQRPRVGLVLAAKHFERHAPPQAQLDRFVDDAHTAAAHFTHDAELLRWHSGEGPVACAAARSARSVHGRHAP